MWIQTEDTLLPLPFASFNPRPLDSPFSASSPPGPNDFDRDLRVGFAAADSVDDEFSLLI